MDIHRQKIALRNLMLDERKRLKPWFKKDIEKQINQSLIDMATSEGVRVIHTYLPIGNEIDITAFIKFCLDLNITVITSETKPKPQLRHLVLTHLDDLETGIFGTRHPRNAIEWGGTYDLILVPGLAFDTNGNRLGYGGGYYDNFLKDHPMVKKVALAFPFQIVDFVPHSDRDVRIDQVVSGKDFTGV